MTTRGSIIGLGKTPDEIDAQLIAHKKRVLDLESTQSKVYHNQEIWRLKHQSFKERFEARIELLNTLYKTINSSLEHTTPIPFFIVFGVLCVIISITLTINLSISMLESIDRNPRQKYYISTSTLSETGQNYYAVFKSVLGSDEKMSSPMSIEDAQVVLDTLKIKYPNDEFYVDMSRSSMCWLVKGRIPGLDEIRSKCYVDFNDAEAKMNQLYADDEKINYSPKLIVGEEAIDPYPTCLVDQ